MVEKKETHHNDDEYGDRDGEFSVCGGSQMPPSAPPPRPRRKKKENANVSEEILDDGDEEIEEGLIF